MDLMSAVVTLFLVMDPLGNIPLFLSTLKELEPKRRRLVLLRELLIAYIVFLLFTLLGNRILHFLGLEPYAVSIAGGIVLFLIALHMIFPSQGGAEEKIEGEPLIVPLAIPLIAGPSTLAAILLLQSGTANTGALVMAVTIAWALTGAILVGSTFFYRILGQRGLTAMERLMGMLLVMVAVQMLINGLRTSLQGR